MSTVFLAAGALAFVAVIWSLVARLEATIGNLQSGGVGRFAAGFATLWTVYFIIFSIGIGLVRLIWQAIAR